MDIYINSWKGFRTLNLYKPTKHLIEPFISEEITSKNYNILKNKDINITRFNINNIFLMFYSIQKCFNLIQKPYDIYIRSRFDLIFTSKLNLPFYIDNILNNFYDLLIPEYKYTFTHDYFPNTNIPCYSDQIAIGNYSAIKYYSNFYSNIIKYITQLKEYDPHKILGMYLDNSKLKIKKDIADYRLVRKSGVITNYSNFNFFDE